MFLKKTPPEQRRMLITLTLVNILFYLDRQIIYPLFPLIKAEFAISDFQLGLLGTVLLLVHSLATLPLGFLADRVHRPFVIAGGIFFWCLVILACGFAPGFIILLILRGLVGIGESSYAPAASAMISDNFPVASRSRAQGLFNSGMFIGGTVGLAIGGLIAWLALEGPLLPLIGRMQWRYTFFFLPAFGMLLGIFCLRLPDRHHHRHEPHIPIRTLASNPAYRWLLVAGALATFATGALITWGVEFTRRYLTINIRDASFLLGGVLVVSGMTGLLVGSTIADRLRKKKEWGYAAVMTITLTFAGPFFFMAMQDAGSGVLFYTGIFLATLLMSVYHGPVAALMHEIVPPRQRASAYAVYIFFIHIFGDTLSPAVVGYISDNATLKFGLELSTLCVLGGGLAFIPIWRLIVKKKVKIYT